MSLKIFLNGPYYISVFSALGENDVYRILNNTEFITDYQVFLGQTNIPLLQRLVNGGFLDFDLHRSSQRRFINKLLSIQLLRMQLHRKIHALLQNLNVKHMQEQILTGLASLVTKEKFLQALGKQLLQIIRASSIYTWLLREIIQKCVETCMVGLMYTKMKLMHAPR